MPFKFYEPVQEHGDNAGLITGLANLRLEARQQKYQRQDQIAKGLMSQIEDEQKFWIEEAKKEGMLSQNYGQASSMKTPLQNVKKIAEETDRLSSAKKGKWTADKGESNYFNNAGKAGLKKDAKGNLVMNKAGDKYINTAGKEVDEETANQLIDSAAGRGNLRQTKGNETGQGRGEKSAAQKRFDAQSAALDGETDEGKDELEKAGEGAIRYEDTAQSRKDAQETKTEAEGHGFDDVTADAIYDAAGQMTMNTEKRYALAQQWVEDNVKDPSKREMLKYQIMRFPEQQKYTLQRGADRGMDEALFINGQKAPRGPGNGAGVKKRRKVLVSADKGLSGIEIFTPEDKTLTEWAADKKTKAEYIRQMRLAIGGSGRKWRDAFELAVKQDDDFQKGKPGGVPLHQNKMLNDFHDMFQDKPNTAQMDTDGRTGAVAEQASIATEIIKQKPDITTEKAMSQAADIMEARKEPEGKGGVREFLFGKQGL